MQDNYMIQECTCSKCNRKIRKELVYGKFEYTINDSENNNLASCVNCLEIIMNKMRQGYE